MGLDAYINRRVEFKDRDNKIKFTVVSDNGDKIDFEDSAESYDSTLARFDEDSRIYRWFIERTGLSCTEFSSYTIDKDTAKDLLKICNEIIDYKQTLDKDTFANYCNVVLPRFNGEIHIKEDYSANSVEFIKTIKYAKETMEKIIEELEAPKNLTYRVEFTYNVWY